MAAMIGMEIRQKLLAKGVWDHPVQEGCRREIALWVPGIVPHKSPMMSPTAGAGKVHALFRPPRFPFNSELFGRTAWKEETST